MRGKGKKIPFITRAAAKKFRRFSHFPNNCPLFFARNVPLSNVRSSSPTTASFAVSDFHFLALFLSVSFLSLFCCESENEPAKLNAKKSRKEQKLKGKRMDFGGLHFCTCLKMLINSLFLITCCISAGQCLLIVVLIGVTTFDNFRNFRMFAVSNFHFLALFLFVPFLSFCTKSENEPAKLNAKKSRKEQKLKGKRMQIGNFWRLSLSHILKNPYQFFCFLLPAAVVVVLITIIVTKIDT